MKDKRTLGRLLILATLAMASPHAATTVFGYNCSELQRACQSVGLNGCCGNSCVCSTQGVCDCICC